METQRALFTLFGNLIKVIEARDTDAYDEALERIPADYRDKYHELLLIAALFTVIPCHTTVSNTSCCRVSEHHISQPVTPWREVK